MIVVVLRVHTKMKMRVGRTETKMRAGRVMMPPCRREFLRSRCVHVWVFCFELSFR